jgi:O-antigen ligase
VTVLGSRVAGRELTVRLVLVWSAVLGSLVDLPGVTTAQRTAALLVLAAGVVAALPLGIRTTLGGASALWPFVLVTVLSYLRDVVQPLPLLSARVMLAIAIMVTLVALLGFCSMLAPMREATRRGRLQCVLLAPVVFTILNLVLYVVGFRFPSGPGSSAAVGSSSPGADELLGLLHISASRASFPLTPGVDGAGAIAALALVVSALLASSGSKRQRLFGIAGIASSIATILLVDSRGPLLWAICALAIIAALPVLRRGVGALPFAILLLPTLLLYVLSKLSALSTVFSRTDGTTDFTTATGREQIWSIVLNFLSHQGGELLYGWGAYGQVRSGVGYRYAYLFPGQLNSQFFSAHNGILQIVLDTGLIGLVMFLWFLVRTIDGAYSAYQASRTSEAKALLGGLMVIGLLGTDEAVPGLATISLLIAVILMGCAAIRIGVPARAGVPVRAARPVLGGGVVVTQPAPSGGSH